MNTLEQQLIAGADALGLPITDSQRQCFMHYLALLMKWNKVYNLTAICEPSAIISKHLLDSLALAEHVTGARIADIGSGAGLPGIPLAIIKPQQHFILLDSNSKKTRFQWQVVHELALNNVHTQHVRLPPKPSDKIGLFDMVTSRAFSSLTKMVQVSHPLLKSKGQWLAMKGVYPDQELYEVQQQYPDVRVQQVITLKTSHNQGQRHLVVLQNT